MRMFRFPTRRSLFIQTFDTPNPLSLKFVPGKPVLGQPGTSKNFESLRSAQSSSPLARSLFRVPGVSRVMLGDDFISVTVSKESDWMIAKHDIFGAITEFYESGDPVIFEQETESLKDKDTVIEEEDDEVVAMIKELIETRIRPAVQEDGGDVAFRGFTKEGVVLLEMQGSCQGCPSSSITLKHGIENMLMHYVPEVTAVEQYESELDKQSEEMLKKIEK